MIQEDKLVVIDIPVEHLNIRIENILRELGDHKTGVDDYVYKVTVRHIQSQMKLIKPWSAYMFKKITELNLKEGSIKIDQTFFNTGKIISSQLKDSEYAALFTCTIGDELEMLSRQLFQEGDGLEGYIANIQGSQAVESLAEYVHEFIHELVQSQNMNITNRFSPGYCGWDIKEQFKLFDFFSSYTIPVKLTETALMNPVKSISGIMGFGEHARFREYPCMRCNEKDCLYRRHTNT